MYPDKEGYSFSLIQYKLSDTEYKEYLKGEEVDFKGKINVIKLASDKISISARLFPCWETYATWVPYEPDASPRYIYYPDGAYSIDTNGHYEYVTTLGTCDDGQTGFTGSVSTVPTGGGIASGTTADLKILNELIKKMYNSNAAEYNKVQWLLSSGELQDFLKIYIGYYYEDSGKTTESVLFSRFLTNFCYENRDSVTKEQVYTWFIDSYSPQYQNNLTKLTSAQLQDFVDINKEIDASPYQEDYIIESNEALVAFQASGYLDNPTEANFQSAVNTLPCCAGMMLQRFISDRINNIVATYFYLRHLHPSWSKGKCFWNASQETIHLLLDVGGMVPVIGEVCDLTNGAIYAIQGDKLNASLSLAGAIPFAGWAATGAKFAIKTTSTGAVIALVKNSSGFFVVSRNQKLFRKVLGMVAGDGRIAHHIIPFALQENSVIQKAILSKNAFMINEALNGIPVSSAVHAGSHSNYNKIIENYLTIFNTKYPNATPDQCYTEIMRIINLAKKAIVENPNIPINQLIF